MNEFLEKLKQDKPQIPKIEGLVWLTMLIKYDMNGKAEVIRSFTKPAKESNVKSFYKPKKRAQQIKIEMESPKEEKKLFD